MNFRDVLFLILLILPMLAIEANAQVLTLEKKPEVKLEPIELSGVIVEQKKYSFTLKSGEKVYEVKVPGGAPVSMQLNQPRFDLQNRRVWVTAAPPADGLPENPVKQVKNKNTGSTTAQPKAPINMVAFDLPTPLYLKASFAHAGQMTRVMSAKILRLNNYTILAMDPGSLMPTPDGQTLEIAGRLDYSGESKPIALVVGEKKFDVTLGHRGATMTGFSIANLDPSTVRLSIKGNVDESGVVSAQSIELHAVQALGN